MNTCKASISAIESLGAVDGPGLRTVIFFNGCKLRCKYCHNPENWKMSELNYTVEDIKNKILRFKPYYGETGGVTFSGGEPLLHSDFIVYLSKKLKNENIHLALDTAGIGIGNYEELLKLMDLIIFDIKDITDIGYKLLTGGNINDSIEFIKAATKLHKKFWIRLVVVPDIHDNEEYMESLNSYIKKHFDTNDIEKIEFLPYHKLGTEKYEKYHIDNPYKDKNAMDKKRCEELYNYFMKIYKSN